MKVMNTFKKMKELKKSFCLLSSTLFIGYSKSCICRCNYYFVNIGERKLKIVFIALLWISKWFF